MSGNTDIEIARLEKSRTQHIRVGLGEFKGRKHIGIRTWVDVAGEDKPTAKGTNIRPDQIDELIDALQRAKGEAQRLGWLSARATA